MVRIALQRGTIHLVTAEDCRTPRPLLQPVLDHALRTTYGKRLAGLDLTALAAEARALVEEEPRTFQQLCALRDPAGGRAGRRDVAADGGAGGRGPAVRAAGAGRPGGGGGRGAAGAGLRGRGRRCGAVRIEAVA
ncbi:DNA glycosylase AlkZ-like family protein [Kitasatospora sp. NPDC001159]